MVNIENLHYHYMPNTVIHIPTCSVYAYILNIGIYHNMYKVLVPTFNINTSDRI